MPVQPDPTHPKSLEGDDVLRQPMRQDDDVEGHLSANVVEEPGSEPEGIMPRNTDEGDDVEGHLR